MKPLLFALPAATLLAGAAFVSAQPAAHEDRRRAVGDWLVEHVAEDDGGLVVRMSREGDDYRLEYREAFWRGNYGPARGFQAARLNCARGGEAGGPDEAPQLAAGEVRRRFADDLAECGASPQEVDAALRGLEGAYALASDWAEEAAAATRAEAEAIADFGNDMMADDNMAMDFDGNMTVDTNMTMDEGPANSSEDPPFRSAR